MWCPWHCCRSFQFLLLDLNLGGSTTSRKVYAIKLCSATPQICCASHTYTQTYQWHFCLQDSVHSCGHVFRLCITLPSRKTASEALAAWQAVQYVQSNRLNRLQSLQGHLTSCRLQRYRLCMLQSPQDHITWCCCRLQLPSRLCLLCNSCTHAGTGW